MDKEARTTEVRLREVLATIRVISRGFAQPFQAGMITVVEEICERMSLEPPTSAEIGLASLAIDFEDAMVELIEKGEVEICGKDDVGNNVYRNVKGQEEMKSLGTVADRRRIAQAARPTNGAGCQLNRLAPPDPIGGRGDSQRG